MTKARMDAVRPHRPIGLRIDQAADFVSMPTTMFERAVREGVMPPPRRFFETKIWDAEELLAAFRRGPRDTLDLKPDVAAAHDELKDQSDPYDTPPRA